jgi:hexosaminidase
MLLPKMLGLAERAWAADPAWATEADTAICKQLYQQSWQAFVNVLGKRELPRLDYLNKGYQYRIPTAGIVVENGTVKANTQFPGMVIRYSIGDAEPTPTSPAYIAPLTVKGKINFRVFNSKGRGGRIVSVVN